MNPPYWFATASLKVDFLKPTPVDKPVQLRARIKEMYVKKICDSTLTMPEDEALEFERKRAAETVLSEQCIEGISAFLEKRAPKWTY